MKKTLFLLLATALQAFAQTGTPPSSLPTVSGSLSSGYYYVVLGTDNELHIATAAQMEAQAQSGVLLSSSINGTALTALGNAPNGSGGILTFGAIGSNVEAWSGKLDTFAALSAPGTSGYVLASSTGGTLSWVAQPSLAALFLTASGTNLYTATPSPALTSYAVGLQVVVTFTNSNTGGASLNLNSLGAVQILQAGSPLGAGQIPAGATLHLVYDGSHFDIIGVSPFTSYTLPTASTTVLGGVMIDGTTIISSGGVISVGTIPYLALHASGSPTIGGSTGAGTSPTVSVTGSDVAGLITVTPGSSPATSATVATVTYNTSYGTAPNAVSLTPANAAAAALSGNASVYLSASNAGTFVITSGSTALTASTQYKWWYQVSQQ
jgi:hypothetical protein